MMFQISTLVSHRERSLCSERSIRAVARVGQAVNLAVERFVTIGETIADDNPEIKTEMYQACKEARAAGQYFAHLLWCLEKYDYVKFYSGVSYTMVFSSIKFKNEFSNY